MGGLLSFSAGAYFYQVSQFVMSFFGRAGGHGLPQRRVQDTGWKPHSLCCHLLKGQTDRCQVLRFLGVTPEEDLSVQHSLDGMAAKNKGRHCKAPNWSNNHLPVMLYTFLTVRKNESTATQSIHLPGQRVTWWSKTLLMEMDGQHELLQISRVYRFWVRVWDIVI